MVFDRCTMLRRGDVSQRSPYGTGLGRKRAQYYAPIQRDILKAAYQMLREGGYLVYSTCTFSPEEDEKNILWFLRQFPDMHVCEVPRKEGF